MKEVVIHIEPSVCSGSEVEYQGGQRGQRGGIMNVFISRSHQDCWCWFSTEITSLFASDTDWQYSVSSKHHNWVTQRSLFLARFEDKTLRPFQAS